MKDEGMYQPPNRTSEIKILKDKSGELEKLLDKADDDTQHKHTAIHDMKPSNRKSD